MSGARVTYHGEDTISGERCGRVDGSCADDVAARIARQARLVPVGQIGTATLEDIDRDHLARVIARALVAYADARVAAVTETAITAMEQADAALVEINPGNYDDVDVAKQNDSVIEASRLLREAMAALRGGPPSPAPARLGRGATPVAYVIAGRLPGPDEPLCAPQEEE